jgi:hypothetical protein
MRVSFGLHDLDYANSRIFGLRFDRQGGESHDNIPNEDEIIRILENFVLPRLKAGQKSFKAEFKGYQGNANLLVLLKDIDGTWGGLFTDGQ